MIFSLARLRADAGTDDLAGDGGMDEEGGAPSGQERHAPRRYVSEEGDTYMVSSAVLGAPYSLGGPAVGLVFTRADDQVMSIARIRADTDLHALTGDELDQILHRSQAA